MGSPKWWSSLFRGILTFLQGLVNARSVTSSSSQNPTPDPASDPKPQPKVKVGPAKSGMICIDAGHGGSDPGTSRGDIKEKDIALLVSKHIHAEFTRLGVPSFLSRPDDLRPLEKEQGSNPKYKAIELKERAAVAARGGAFFILSVHVNSISDPRVRGIEAFYHRESVAGKNIARRIVGPLGTATGIPFRRVASDTSLYSSGLGVLRHSESSGLLSCLLELGFLTSDVDRRILTSDSYPVKAARAIAIALAPKF